MDYEAKRLLEENLELSRENNRLLHKLRRAQLWGRVLTLIWWAIIIGVPVVLYYYVVQPYIGDISESYKSFQSDVGRLPITDFFQRAAEFLGDAGGADATSSDSIAD